MTVLRFLLHNRFSYYDVVLWGFLLNAWDNGAHWFGLVCIWLAMTFLAGIIVQFVKEKEGDR